MPRAKRNTEVMFVRCTADLKKLIKQERKRVQQESPHRSVSDADIVRQILYNYFATRADCAE